MKRNCCSINKLIKGLSHFIIQHILDSTAWIFKIFSLEGY
jgi:hypothetical protein